MKSWIHPALPTIKVLQTSKISKLRLLSLSPMILNNHCSPHTLPFTPSLLLKQEAHDRLIFNSVISNQITTSKISKSPQVRSPIVQPRLWIRLPIRKFLSCNLQTANLQLGRQRVTFPQFAPQQTLILQIVRQQTPTFQIAR